MKFWSYDSRFFLLGFFLSLFFFFFFFVVSWWVASGVVSGCGYISPYFIFDSISVYLVFLTVVIALCVVFLGHFLDNGVLWFVLLSQSFSLFCYVCCHALFFWIFYELSIVTLLYLLLKDSPYSERYSAFWYFSGYVIFSGLPMMLVLLYFSFSFGCFSLSGWDISFDDYNSILLLSILFMTKIPLFPFQVWLPIVHAEASSVVSICLSGYIMKLGVLGLFRFCSLIISDYLFFLLHVGFMLLVSLFFFVCCSLELDCKRWLAFLSLSHISIVPLCLGLSVGEVYNVSFGYCLGHGLSTTLTFLLFWFMSDVCGSRNWLILSRVVSGSFCWCFLFVLCFCVCSSFPPSLMFFSELKVLCSSLWYSGLISFIYSVYLFFGGLVPLIFLGFVLTRFSGLGFSWVGLNGPLVVLFFLSVLNSFCFLLF